MAASATPFKKNIRDRKTLVGRAQVESWYATPTLNGWKKNMLDGHAQGKTARLPYMTGLNTSMIRG
jgi:hypothetical protein